MKERPILFSGEMVRAILDGRKTQTRRVVKQQPPEGAAVAYKAIYLGPDVENDPRPKLVWNDGFQAYGAIACPYGQPGGRLWVREEWRIYAWQEGSPLVVEYRDGVTRECCEQEDEDEYLRLVEQSSDDCAKAGLKLGDDDCYVIPERADGGGLPTRWRRSMFMFRWASRITLELTEVRVQRLQEISEEDAWAEGVTVEDGHKALALLDGETPVRVAYWHLWEKINAKRGYGWDSNPWVWALTFKRVAESA